MGISVGLWAKEITDTLESTKRNRVIVTYDITQSNGQFVIKFIDANKKLLEPTYRDKYKKLDEVAVLFFDKVGSFEDNTKFSGISPEAFMRPPGIKYKSTGDGYFILNDHPTISLELISTEPAEISIPMYLAHYEGKRHYKIFSRCQDLIVKLSSKRVSGISSGKTSRLTTQTITSQEEVEGMVTEEDVANHWIDLINELLVMQKEYPFDEDLQEAKRNLIQSSSRITDSKVSSRIKETLNAYKIKEEELKGNAKAAEAAAEKEAERKARLAEKQAQARQDSIAAAAQLQAEKEKKQNLWLIIGGGILVILAFIGNQVFQHFRNVKNQKSIMDMQQSVVKRAEDEAKRRARNMAQSQINRVQGEARRKTRTAINNGVGKISKGKSNKGFSI